MRNAVEQGRESRIWEVGVVSKLVSVDSEMGLRLGGGGRVSP